MNDVLQALALIAPPIRRDSRPSPHKYIIE